MATTSGQHPGARAQSNGVLPVTASQTAPKASLNKSSGPKLKVVVRRLAPALTDIEFMKALGDDWKTGKGKVDWYLYKPGKDSKDPSKPSRPSRAYLHLTNDTHLISFLETVRHGNFEDAQNTWNSPTLLGPPSVEFSPYGRIPSGRRRTDARQGTIDQDPEFMDFLESLANPVSIKDASGDGDGDAVKGEKVTITPLVQFLKEKKASKGKEAAAKAAKIAKDAQIKASAKSSKDSSASTEDAKKTPKELKKEKLIVKAAREAVKATTRETATKTPVASAPEPTKTPRSQPRERGSIAAAARILQRDLGLSPGNAHRKAKADADNAAKAVNEVSSSSSASASPKPAHTPGSTKGRATRGMAENDKPQSSAKEKPLPVPITLLKKPAEAPPPVAPPTAPAHMPKPAPARKPQQPSAASPGATRAFVKHANPSQGVTELLLKEAMEVFGAVSHVEIDKRKGFAYVDFVDHEGLVKAMAANPTKIAQGTVQVLERKETRAPAREPPAGPSGRGGGFQGRGRGGPAGRRGGRGGARGGPDTAAPVPSAPTGPTAEKAPPSAPSGPAAAAATTK